MTVRRPVRRTRSDRETRTIRLQAGDVVRMLTHGGGGWGAPVEVG